MRGAGRAAAGAGRRTHPRDGWRIAIASRSRPFREGCLLPASEPDTRRRTRSAVSLSLPAGEAPKRIGEAAHGEDQQGGSCRNIVADVRQHAGGYQPRRSHRVERCYRRLQCHHRPHSGRTQPYVEAPARTRNDMHTGFERSNTRVRRLRASMAACPGSDTSVCQGFLWRRVSLEARNLLNVRGLRGRDALRFQQCPAARRPRSRPPTVGLTFRVYERSPSFS